MQRLLIIGCGDVLRRALPWLTRRYRVYATARGDAAAAELRGAGATPIRADLDDRRGLRRLAGVGNLVLHSAPPQDRGDRDLRTRRLLAALASRRSVPRRLAYISTTGVYGDHGGGLVTEANAARPTTARAQRRADAEAVLRRFGRRNRSGIVVLRAPGIYAADRLPVERIRRADPVLRREDDVYTNHIHAEDLARIASLALVRGGSCRAYNACDDSALMMGDYFDLVADAFGLPRPPRLSRQEAAQRLSPVTMSFMRESRRLSNARLKRELRLRLRYPDVSAGLAAARRGT